MALNHICDTHSRRSLYTSKACEARMGTPLEDLYRTSTINLAAAAPADRGCMYREVLSNYQHLAPGNTCGMRLGIALCSLPVLLALLIVYAACISCVRACKYVYSNSSFIFYTALVKAISHTITQSIKSRNIRSQPKTQRYPNHNYSPSHLDSPS